MIKFKFKIFNNLFLNYRLKNVFLFSKYLFFFHKTCNSFDKNLLLKSLEYDCNLFYLKSKYLEKIFKFSFFISDIILVRSDNFFKLLNFVCILDNMKYNYMYFSYNRFLINSNFFNLSDLLIWFNYYNCNYNFFIVIVKGFLGFICNLILQIFHSIFLWINVLKKLS